MTSLVGWLVEDQPLILRLLIVMIIVQQLAWGEITIHNAADDRGQWERAAYAIVSASQNMVRDRETTCVNGEQIGIHGQTIEWEPSPIAPFPRSP